MYKLLFAFALLTVMVSPVHAQPGSVCGSELSYNGISGANVVYFNIGPGLENLAADDATQRWNNACSGARKPFFSLFGMPADANSVTEKVVNVRLEPGQSPASQCPGGEGQCYAVMSTHHLDNPPTIKIFSEVPDGQGNIVHPLTDFTASKLEDLFVHELGHLLGLEDDTNCPLSIMGPTVNEATNGAILQEHCDVLQTRWDTPLEPVSNVTGGPLGNSCVLDDYCILGPDGLLDPWPIVRNRCSWVPTMTVQQVEFFFFGIQINLIAVTSSEKYVCASYGDLSGLTEPEPPIFDLLTLAPMIMTFTPAQGAAVEGPTLEVAGALWARDRPIHDVEFLLDGEPVTPTSFATSIALPGLCSNPGISPYCTTNSGFRALFDTTGWQTGYHHLEVVAADDSEDPKVSVHTVQFSLDGPAPNQNPVAVNDSTAAGVSQIGPQLALIDVVDNDSDPDGDPLRLPQDALVTFPSKGWAAPVSDTEILYSAYAGQSGSDVFTYKVVDDRGGESLAQVHVNIVAATGCVNQCDSTGMCHVSCP